MQHDSHVKAFLNTAGGVEYALNAIYEALFGYTTGEPGWNDWSRAAADGAWN